MLLQQFSQQRRRLLFENQHHTLEAASLVYYVQSTSLLVGFPAWKFLHIQLMVQLRHSRRLRRQWNTRFLLAAAKLARELLCQAKGLIACLSMLEDPDQVSIRWVWSLPNTFNTSASSLSELLETASTWCHWRRCRANILLRRLMTHDLETLGEFATRPTQTHECMLQWIHSLWEHLQEHYR